MIRDRFQRFRNIERPRRPEDDPPQASPSERIRRVEGPGGAGTAEPPIPASATERFRPPAERPLEVAETAEGEQPFRRCARCEMDNARFAEACQNCGADLRTPEQEGFNQRLWAKRRQESAEEARVLADGAAERERLAERERQARVAMATEMARMEADRVEGELDRASGRDPWGRWGSGAPYDPDAPWSGPSRAPLGLRWLRAIRNPLLRIAVVAVAVAVPVLLVVLGARGGSARFAGMMILVVLLGLFSPPSWRYRRRGWWGW